MLPIPNDIKRFKIGKITANGTTEVTITAPKLELDSVIIASLNTVGGTPAAVYISTKTPSTGVIGFKSAASNTSVYDIYVFA